MSKYVILTGVIIVIIGILMWFGIPIGRLPGDFSYQGESFVIYFPIATMVILSLFISVILWIIRR